MIDLKGTYTRLTFTVPMRGLFGFRMEFLSQTRGNGVMAHTYLGYREWAGKIIGRRNGVLVSDRAGTVATYAVSNIQDRGRLFVSAGDTVYAGQIVGETMHAQDLTVNPTKQKHLTNMRSSTSDIAAKIDAPAILALDQMMDYINEDELLEVTPRSLRMRKRRSWISKRESARRWATPPASCRTVRRHLRASPGIGPSSPHALPCRSRPVQIRGRAVFVPHFVQSLPIAAGLAFEDISHYVMGTGAPRLRGVARIHPPGVRVVTARASSRHARIDMFNVQLAVLPDRKTGRLPRFFSAGASGDMSIAFRRR
ncbi:MAG: hypothetical protein MZW92_68785 [Comamonadaceae bacterium]|nr:hypothetical protein [Comamonadaceae bacterium]